jgi:hypothetical protein
MQVLKRLLMGFGSILAAALLLALAAPKSAHALVAALVQVTNTPANPVPVVDVQRAAQQSVELECNPAEQICYQIQPDGSNNNTAWVVPSGMHYVVSDVEVTSETAPGYITSVFDVQWTVPSGATHAEGWQVLSNGATTEFQFPSGIIVVSGSTVGCQAAGPIGFAFVRGYLMAN